MPTEIYGEIKEPKLLSVTGDRVAAYNYNYFEFTATVPDTGDYATVTVLGIPYILQPDNNGLFTFNTYEFSKELFIYKDAFDYTGDFIDPNQSIKVTFDIKIVLFDAQEELQTLDLTFFNGVFQRWENPVVQDGTIVLSDSLTPFWTGYPFDVSQVIGDDVKRVYISDGDDILADAPCGIGFMTIGGTFIVDAFCETLSDVLDIIDSDCGGYYLRWHNSKYGYSYYLFEDVAYEKYNTKSLGDVREKFAWTDNYFDIGKDGQRSIDLFAKIPYKHREIIKSLINSNEVYLYTGKKGDIANDKMWLEVKTSKTKLKETNKDILFDYPLTILLPKEKTRTRI